VGRVRRVLVTWCLGRAAGRSSGAGSALAAADADLLRGGWAWLRKRRARVGWRSSPAQAMPARSPLVTPSSGTLVNKGPDHEGLSVPAGAQAQGVGLTSLGLRTAAGNCVGRPALYYSFVLFNKHACPAGSWPHGAATPCSFGSKRLALRLGGFGVSADRSCDPAQLGGERLSSLQSGVAASCFMLAEWCTCLP